MKYSVLGFNQEVVLSYKREVKDGDKSVVVKLDLDDLFILKEIADLANRPSIEKKILDGAMYCWIQYKLILEDLPILDISKKRLQQRLDKLCMFDLIERRVEKVQGVGTFHYVRVSNEYENLLYDRDRNNFNTDGNIFLPDGNIFLPKDNSTIQDNNTQEKEEDKSSSQKKQCVDYQAIFNTWNEVVANIEGISTITKMSEKRKKYISTLIKSCDTNVEEILRVIKTLPYADHWVTSKKAESEWSFSFDWFFTNTKNWFIRALEGDMHKKNAEIFKSIMAGEVPVSTPTESKDTITIGGIVYR
jgi:hypothetical protein